MTIDWAALQASASANEDLEELKKEVDLVGVCTELGVTFTEQNEERWTGHCPVHVDENPSFAVWWDFDRGYQKCGCWSCSFGTGDVFDLVQAVHGCTLSQAIRWVSEYRARQQGTVAPPESRQNEPTEDLYQITQAALGQARAGHLDGLRTLLVEKKITAPADWLVNEFSVGVDDRSRVVIPHMSREGQVSAVKRRSYPDWTPMAVRGSKLQELYGIHRLKDHKKIVVCEGESDTWTTAYTLRNEEYDVVGLPHGAGPGKAPKQNWLEVFKDKEVILLFDADRAGREGLREWLGALGKARVAQLEEGKDATSAGSQRLRHAINTARYFGDDMPPGLTWQDVALIRGDTPVANFFLRLERSIILDGEEIVFEVRLPDDRVVQLSSRDLGSDSRIVAWANAYGYVWYGNRRDAQELMRILTMESVFVPRVSGTRVAGWHDGTFVFPQPVGAIGDSSWAYVPPVADINIATKVHLRADDWDRSIPSVLRSMHAPEVITPILGWVAAAPLRSWCAKFPILGVVGGAGTGKTTLLGVVLRSFGFDLSTMLTATTPHAVHSLAAATNSVPVWFDEYRGGARVDAKLTLEQVIRDAWDGGVSMKGGLQDNRQALTYLPAYAPIVVSGEDAFSETSHLERMILLPMPSRGRNAAALERLINTNTVGFGRSYFEWLAHSYAEERLPEPPVVFDRMSQGRAIVEWGWDLLSTFTREVCGYDLGETDLSLVRKSHEESTKVPIIVDMLSEFYLRADNRGFLIVWKEDEDICVRITDFVRYINRETDATLPGGSRAVKNWLTDRWPSSEERNTWGRFTRLKGAAAEVLSQ